MEYQMLLFTLLLFHSAESYATSERYDEYYNNNHFGDTKNSDNGKPVKPNTSASYEVTEKVDDIPDNRPKPGPVIPNYTVEKPLNLAQDKIDNNQNDDKTENDSEADNNSRTKNKYFQKYDYKKNWTGIKGNGRSGKGDDENDLFDYFKIENFDDSDGETRAGFYDSVKEVVSDFKNKIWNSFNSLFGKDDHSI